MENLVNMESLLNIFILSLFGMVIFGLAFFIMVKISPFSVTKEIEEDQNTSLSILFGSVFIAIAIVISAGIN